MRSHPLAPLLVLAAALAVTPLTSSCDGTILDPGSSGGAGGGGGGGAGGGGPGGTGEHLAEPTFHFDMEEAAAFPGLRMMTRDELRRTVRDLTGVTPDTSDLPPELEVMNLTNDAQRSFVRDARHMRSLLELATDVARDSDVASVVPCGDEGCSDAEVERFLERAFADRIAPEETATYAGIYAEAAAEGGDGFGRRAVLQAALVSPRFMYRTELGDGTGQLTGPELAKKLSYFLWGTGPDGSLRAAGLDGSLLAEDVYRAQVDRLLADDRTRGRFLELVFQWLGIDRFDLATQQGASDLPEGIQADMEREVEMLVLTTLFDEGRSLRELFRAESTFVNGRLAGLYGMEGVTGDEWRAVSLEGTERRGILTTALVLAAHAKEDGRSPMQRGKFLVDEVMCHAFPPEAGAAIMELPEGEYDNFRERFQPLEENQPCNNCHRVLNAGFAFDIFDNVGRRWPMEEVASEEARGKFDLPPHDVLYFDDTVQAVEGFADHPALGPCFVAQTYRFAQGRIPGSQDAEAFGTLLESFEAADQDVVGLLRDIALSQRFRTALTSE